MGRPRTTSDEQILAIARECFLEHGPGAATALIASRLGISHAILFQRFGTKESLMRAALTPKLDPSWLEEIRSGPDGRAGRTQLRELAASVFRMYQSAIPGIAVLRSAGLVPKLPLDKPENLPQVQTRREIEAWFTRAASRKIVRATHSQHAADLLLGALLFRPFQQHIGRVAHTPAENIAFLEFVVDAVWNAVRPTRTPSATRLRPKTRTAR
jgi:AcrR family transcriptional regulator